MRRAAVLYGALLINRCAGSCGIQAAERAGFGWEAELRAEEASGLPGHAALQEAVGKGEYVAVSCSAGCRLVRCAHHICR